MPGSGPGGRWFKSIRPDQSFRFSNLQNAKVHWAPSAGPRCHWLKSICLNQCLFFQFNALHSVIRLRVLLHFADKTYNFGVFVSVWQTAILLSVGLSENRKS